MANVLSDVAKQHLTSIGILFSFHKPVIDSAVIRGLYFTVLFIYNAINRTHKLIIIDEMIDACQEKYITATRNVATKCYFSFQQTHEHFHNEINTVNISVVIYIV